MTETIGARLVRLRTRSGLSQRQLTEGLARRGGRGVTAAYVSRLEHDERVPSMTAAIAIASRLPGVTGLELLFGSQVGECPLCRRGGGLADVASTAGEFPSLHAFLEQLEEVKV